MFRPHSIAAWCVLLATCANAAAQHDTAFDEPSGTLTLRDAVGAALLGSPTLAAFQWDIRAADARTVQAGLRPNPELGVEVEDVRWTDGPEQRVRTRTLDGGFQPGTVSVPTLQPDQTVNVTAIMPSATAGWEAEREQGAHSGFAESEFTLSISQEVELGRKRAKRVALANREKELAQWDYEAARADVIATTAAAFTDLLAAQERLGLQEELLALAQDVARSIGLRVEAGQASPLQNNRAQVSLAATRRARDRAAREITIARARLAANWGSTNPLFSEVAGPLERVDEVPPLDTLLDTIENNPDLARWSAELAAREAHFQLARAQRIPNPTLELGLKSIGLEERSVTSVGFDSAGGFGFSDSEAGFDRDRDNSLVLGLSMPLPVFDRNQGNIAEAGHLVSKTADERRATEVTVHTRIAVAREEAAIAREEVRVIRDEELTQATETFDKTRRGYEQGKFSYLDVLDAQRTLFDLRTELLDALRRYHIAIIDIERRCGGALDDWDRPIPAAEEAK